MGGCLIIQTETVPGSSPFTLRWRNVIRFADAPSSVCCARRGIEPLGLAATSNATPVYDLNSDWSNTANPNGPWAYYGGTTLLPYDANWTPLAPFGGCVQQGFAPGNFGAPFLPVIFEGVCIADDGGIVTHTWDYANGAPGYNPDNVVFTAPFAGIVDISGSLQIDPVDIFPNPIFGRPQDWYLLINGVQMGAGVLGDADPTQILSQIGTFDFPNVSLYAGEPVELEMIAAGLGTFIDINMTVDYAVPEPSTLLLFGSALIGLGAVRRRTRKTV